MTVRLPRVVVTLADPSRDPLPDIARRKNALYVDSVVRHGAAAIPIDASASAADRAAALESMEGLLITGGTDLDPSLYGAANSGSRSVDRERDDLELEAFRAADGRGLPVLGICRGMQAMNVFSGGGLVQHLDDHGSPAWSTAPARMHPIRVVPGTSFARIVVPGDDAGGSVLHVNTYHHQGLTHEHLAPGYRAAAWADSPVGDLVEAFEAPHGPFRMAVQCHPERVESSPPELERLFATFVAACRDLLAER